MPTSTMCLIARNEERGIAEWIAYQKALGFDRVFVYDNDSSDSTAEIVGRICQLDNSLTYRKWPTLSNRRAQTTAYNHALSRCTTDWIAFFDADEFLVLNKHRSVQEYLSNAPEEVSGIAVNWLIFGSSGRTEAGDGLVIDRFERCSKADYFKNRHVKSLARTADVEEVYVHTCKLRRGLYVNGDFDPVQIHDFAQVERISHRTAQINHYLLKSEEEYMVKVSRGNASRSPEEMAREVRFTDEFWRDHDKNCETNHRIKKMRRRLRARLAKWLEPTPSCLHRGG